MVHFLLSSCTSANHKVEIPNIMLFMFGFARLFEYVGDLCTVKYVKDFISNDAVLWKHLDFSILIAKHLLNDIYN